MTEECIVTPFMTIHGRIYVSCSTIRSPIKIHRPAEKMTANPKTISSLKRTRYNHMLNIRTEPVAGKKQFFSTLLSDIPDYAFSMYHLFQTRNVFPYLVNK